MKKYIFILVCFLFLTPSSAQTEAAKTEPIIGDWKGVITQNTGGYRPQYDFEIFIRKNDAGDYIGQTYSHFENSYAKMSFKGKWVEDTFHFEELETLDAVELNDMDWCIKKGKLVLERRGNKLLLTGSWTGASSFGRCVPGYIVLKKKDPRA